jgi:hypothetical protein
MAGNIPLAAHEAHLAHLEGLLAEVRHRINLAGPGDLAFFTGLEAVLESMVRAVEGIVAQLRRDLEALPPTPEEDPDGGAAGQA